MYDYSVDANEQRRMIQHEGQRYSTEAGKQTGSQENQTQNPRNEAK
jgi:hypothetical protein